MHRCYPFPSGFVRWQAWHRAKSDRDTRLSARFRGRHAPLGIIAHRSLASFLRLQCGSLSHLLGPDTKLVNPPIENHRGLKDRPAAQHMLAQAVQLLLIPTRSLFMENKIREVPVGSTPMLSRDQDQSSRSPKLFFDILRSFCKRPR